MELSVGMLWKKTLGVLGSIDFSTIAFVVVPPRPLVPPSPTSFSVSRGSPRAPGKRTAQRPIIGDRIIATRLEGGVAQQIVIVAVNTQSKKEK